MEIIIEQAHTALIEGKTLLYPTDTIWGIGCAADNDVAISRLYQIKERDPHKSMLILVSETIIDLDDSRLRDLLLYPDRPTTVILPESIWRKALHVDVSSLLPATDGSLGIRLPRHDFCQQLIRLSGKALVSTSANLSGQPSPHNHAEISPELIHRVDFAVPPMPAFDSNRTEGSSIVKVDTDYKLTVIRP